MMQTKTQTVTLIEAQRVSQILSEREGVQYKFFRFLNLSRLSLVFVSDTGEQRVLAGENVKQLLKENEHVRINQTAQ